MVRQFTIKEMLLFTGFCIALLGYFLYSFTQIDLSLAFSRNEAIQSVVRSFQQIGYFNRPLSANLFLGTILILFAFYMLFLWLAAKNKLQKKLAWMLVGAVTVILTFSYNAFSYDIFNYIFDAKIITNYGDNPYVQKALDYPEDPMLSFMRWTHRDYPYGPLWLGLTVPLSFLGFQLFLPTYILFKVFIVASYVGSVYFIGKILQKVAPEREVSGLVLYGLNPLVFTESVVSAHIDSVMMFFALWAIYLLVQEKKLAAYGLLFVSIGVKFVTAVLLPIFLLIQRIRGRKMKFSWELIFFLCVILMIGGAVAQVYRGTFQPWYLLDVLAIAALISHRYYIVIPTVVISLAALLNYLPFLFYGNWDKPIPQMLADLNFVSYSVSFLLVAFYFFVKQAFFFRQQKRKKSKYAK
jgi:4-amino-4-deoxy-L-arabinose transferase-like glycosyltransferase